METKPKQPKKPKKQTKKVTCNNCGLPKPVHKTELIGRTRICDDCVEHATQEALRQEGYA